MINHLSLRKIWLSQGQVLEEGSAGGLTSVTPPPKERVSTQSLFSTPKKRRSPHESLAVRPPSSADKSELKSHLRAIVERLVPSGGGAGKEAKAPLDEKRVKAAASFSDEMAIESDGECVEDGIVRFGGQSPLCREDQLEEDSADPQLVKPSPRAMYVSSEVRNFLTTKSIELMKPLQFALKEPTIFELANKAIQACGLIFIIVDRNCRQNAICEFSESRNVIRINPSLPFPKDSKFEMMRAIAYLIYELRNMIIRKTYMEYRKLISDGRISINKFVWDMEKLSYKNISNTYRHITDLVAKGIMTKEFPEYSVFSTFEMHYLNQQLTGHSECFASYYQEQRAPEKHPYTHFFPAAVEDSDKPILMKWLGIRNNRNGCPKDMFLALLTKHIAGSGYSENLKNNLRFFLKSDLEIQRYFQEKFDQLEANQPFPTTQREFRFRPTHSLKGEERFSGVFGRVLGL